MAQKDELICLFIAYRIRQGDLGYSRIDQVPSECRQMAEIKQALADRQRNNPVMEVNSSDRAWIKRSVDELSRYLKNSAPITDQMPPTADAPAQRGAAH